MSVRKLKNHTIKTSFETVVDEATVYADPNTNAPTKIIDNSFSFEYGVVNFRNVGDVCDFKLFGNDGDFWVTLYQYSFSAAADEFAFPMQYLSPYTKLAIAVDTDDEVELINVVLYKASG